MEGTTGWFANLVEGVGGDSRCKGHPRASPKDMALFWAPLMDESEHYHLPLPAPKCLCQKDFLSMPDLRLSCWDIWEEQQTKTVTYAQTLQYWAKRASPPTLGQPCLLARFVLDLHKMMEKYVWFCNDIILGSVALPEGFLSNQTKLTASTDVLPAPTNIPMDEVPMAEPAPIKEQIMLRALQKE